MEIVATPSRPAGFGGIARRRRLPTMTRHPMTWRRRLSLFGSPLALSALLSCGRPNQYGANVPAPLPLIHPGCERIVLYEPHHPIGFEYRPIGELTVRWKDRSKDLRAWLVNEACALGAAAVVQVVESVGSDDEGLPIYAIRGTPIVFGAVPRPYAAPSSPLPESTEAPTADENGPGITP